ncbi:hypothetical protein [Halovenus halobia]|uniref:hypothetical protein n=1 Tax=Halovenus halobia TaxID=3396622 RepID=UPI003F56D4B3
MIARTEEYQVGTLEPGESTRVERVVVVNDINKNPDQLPDELRFELSYRAGSEADNRDWTDYEWGFRLVAVGGN